MIKKITHRMGWKILSVVLAFFLWILVVNYEDPIITRDFKNLIVEKINAGAITKQNKEIEYNEGESVDVTVKGKRSILDRMSNTDIRAFADLSKMSITGAIDIEVVTSEGIQVISKYPADMTITLENIIKAQKEVQFYFEGEPADSYEALEPTITPNIIQISGPESLVNTVASVLITITVEGAKKDITLFAQPQLLDSENNEIKNVTANVDRVSVLVPIEKVRTIPVIISGPNELPEGYVITNKTQDVQTITIRGQEAVVDAISSITIDNVTLAEKTENTAISLNLEDYLPDTIYIKNGSTYVNVNYSIEKLEQKVVTILSQDITIKNIPEGLEFSYDKDMTIELTFSGIQSELDKITLESLNPNIRLLGLLPGEQQVQLFYTLPPSITSLSEPPMLNITLVEEETP